jgi:hypothetical protein
MQRIWKYVFLCWAIICLASGYRMLAPGRTGDFKALSWSFIVAGFIFWCIAPLAVTALNFHGLDVMIRRPSLDRPPWGGRPDPLQFFRFCRVSTILMLLGACFALPKADQGGMMMFWATTAMTIAFFIGERLVYLVYAKKIAKSADQPGLK